MGGGNVCVNVLMDEFCNIALLTMDAHDFDSIERAFAEAETISGKPVAIIQKSIKGKGVSFMENQVSWHGSAPNKEQYEQAMKELDAQLKELED